MDEDLVVRLVGVLVTLIILPVAITVVALLGTTLKKYYAVNHCVVLLSIGGVVAVHHFEDRINTLG